MTIQDKNTFLKSLDEAGFLDLGSRYVAYVREIDWHGSKRFAVHAADGEALVIAPSYEAAMQTLVSQEREPVTLH